MSYFFIFRIFGSTEDVFCLKDELYEGPPMERKSKTAIEMLGGSTVQKSIDRPQDKMMMKMKRQLDRSCLEKGPPAAKVSKYLPPVSLAPRIVSSGVYCLLIHISKVSVLKYALNKYLSLKSCARFRKAVITKSWPGFKVYIEF